MLNNLFKKFDLFLCQIFAIHDRPKDITFNGSPYEGHCPKCGKKLQKNNEGRWE